jgi:Fe-S cluster assembly protein SufD
MTRAQAKQRKRDDTAARLEGATLPSGAQWATDQREAAHARLLDMGLPVKRDEYWKWTNPATLISSDVKPTEPFSAEAVPLFAQIDVLKVVFTDGVFDAAASDDLTGEGLEIELLTDALSAEDHWVKDVFGAIELSSQTPVERPLAAMNTAFATDGIVIRALAKVSKPVSLIYLHTDGTSDVILRHIVKVEEGASLTLLENGAVATRSNTALEVDVANTGAFHHVRVQGRDHDRRAVTNIFARIGAECMFKSFTMTANGVLTRNEAFIELLGDDSMAHIAGLCMGDGRSNGGFLQDDTVFVTHDAERCESRQVFKKVLRNGATGVFQGKILVKDGAQKTDGYQISQSLLMDDDSQFLAKPELEIYADDVICSHGSTTGAIDEQAHFYLRSRGVSATEATDLLTLAFLAEAIDEIEDEAISEDILEHLEAWLTRRPS